MKLSAIIVKLLYIYLGLVLVLFAFCGESSLINITSILLISLLVVFLCFLLTIGDPSNPLIIFWVLLTFMWFLVRFLYLIPFPDEANLQRYIYFESSYMNRALVYLLFGTILSSIGFRLGSVAANLLKRRVYLKRRASEKSKDIFSYLSPENIAVLGILISGISIFNYFVLGRGRFSGQYTHFGWLFSFISYEPILLIAIILTDTKWRFLNRQQKFLILLFWGVFVTYRVLVGSRSALFGPLMFWLLYKFAKEGNPKIERKHITLIFIGFGVSIPLFFFTTSTRFMWDVQWAKGNIISFSDFVEVASHASFSPYDILKAITNRFSLLEHLVVIVNNTGENVKEYVNFGNVFKASVNYSIPGDPFPHVLVTSRAFSVVYRHWGEEFAERNHMTDGWTLLGILYVHFGWLGGLIATFSVSFILAIIYKKLCRIKTVYKILWRVWFMLLINRVFLNFGIDEIWLATYHLTLTGTIYIVSLRFVSLLQSRLKHRRNRINVHSSEFDFTADVVVQK